MSKRNEKCPYELFYEDDQIIVVYKKRDVFSVSTEDKKTYTHNLFYYLKQYLKKKNETCFIIHRLDFETSGLMIFGKNEKITAKIRATFASREAKRYYEAVVKETIPLGTECEIRQNLLEKGNTVIISEEPESKEAITKFRAVNYINIGTALNIEILTGRRNQIRIALHSKGLTLLGDKRYSNDENKRMYLNCYMLSFPKTEGLSVTGFKVDPLWIIKEKK